MNAAKLQPLGENILVKVLKPDTKTKTGLILPETADADRPQQGRIISVGEDKGIKLKKGQLVVFAKYSGTEIKIGKEEYLIIKNEDVLAVLK